MYKDYVSFINQNCRSETRIETLKKPLRSKYVRCVKHENGGGAAPPPFLFVKWTYVDLSLKSCSSNICTDTLKPLRRFSFSRIAAFVLYHTAVQHNFLWHYSFIAFIVSWMREPKLFGILSVCWILSTNIIPWQFGDGYRILNRRKICIMRLLILFSGRATGTCCS